ncbi:MAG: ATP-binding cassette domain-containing protein [Gomphosphaeria aponina SAG 52.96 = DSM 107014]|uniref:ATP-binding cassette domain-containing protein n=1 Tax=Gomphosphaeria aponina SAG 52.96 = DSM 107014 TaxID=1521640 RepID=A0A941GW29_9CHRO|nr:ATP-binding cassette domain-containing protein [Gomphosphaeria aponina SAG 52.96 = DSM 107014]
MAQVVLENIYKSFPSEAKQGKSGKVNVLRGIDLTVQDGEFMVLVGPSGCGKSTVLRLIAGLEELTGGKIWVGSRLVNNLPPKARDIAMVFQNYALYPHLSVADNIAFGMRRMGQKKVPSWGESLLVGMTRKLPKQIRYISENEKQIQQQVSSVAQLLQIDSLLGRLPKELSGGQKQRVALGRAIARNPQVFLMDEPLSNLDAKLRTETRAQIVKLQRQLGTTTIYVTHDQTEAMTMGDRIAVMNEGKIMQIAQPLQLYHRPANLFVAEFIGSPPMNFIPVKVSAPLLITHEEFRLTLPDVWGKILQEYDGGELLLGIRPEHLHLSPAATKNLPVKVDLVEALGNDTYIFGSLNHEPLVARIAPDYGINSGESIWLSMNLEKIHLFDPETGNNLPIAE